MPKQKAGKALATAEKAGTGTEKEAQRLKAKGAAPPGAETDKPGTGFTSADQPVKSSPAPEGHFPIVGVGASAGGLEAFTQLLQNLAPDTGMGFVLVQHMAPRAHSMLPELLAKVSRMQVSQVKDGMKVEPNHVYVTPPGIGMTLEEGVLHLATRSELRGQRPIDDFLRSLAQDRGSRSVGVILSGTASDGVLGLQAIKAEGGITFAQEVKTAKYPGMPESAIAAGVVDFILPPDKIARQLARLAHHSLVAAASPEEETLPVEETVFNQILALLKSSTGLDFTFYKHSTIKRRINRRMMLRQVEKMAEYLRHLRQDAEEVKSLYEDILINVTSFFREPEAFEALQNTVYPEMMRNRALDEPVRIWVPGCSSGEEAYSLAISLLEYLGETADNVQIQVFATDVEDGVIDRARLGIYPEAIAADVSPQRLRRFFVKVAGGYQVSKAIRSICIFARQNLIKDPPFSRLDLISCRNVLIYFGPVLQKKVIPIFHFALKPGGYLLLGKSEALSAFPELFTLVDKKIKIFLKKAVRPPHLVLPHLTAEPSRLPRSPGKTAGTTSEAIVSPADLQAEADRLILTRFAPSGVVIDSDMNIINFRGHTGHFLEPAPGEASLNLIRMAREGLQTELRSAVYAALKNNLPLRKEGLRMRYNGGVGVVNLEVVPLRPADALERYFLVVFEDATPPAPPLVKEVSKEPKKKSSAKDRQIAELKGELATTKEYLQAVIEEQETSVEELKSTNEELMSANEELQSINEEMETSKEELQSTNEELATLNEELENRNQELNQVNNDLNNLLTTMDTALVMLGPDLRIRRFNPTAQEMLNLIPADLGRPIGDIRLLVDVPDLEQVIKGVLETLAIKYREVQDRAGRWYNLRLQPYRTVDNKIDGVIMTLVDIDVLKRSLQEAHTARNYAEGIIATVREPLVVLNSDLKVVSANESFYGAFKLNPLETENQLFYDLGNRQWDIPRLRELLEDILPTNQHFKNFEVEYDFPGVDRRIMLLSGRRLSAGEVGKDLILLAFEDITDRRQAERALKESEARLRDLAQQLLTLQEEERQELSCELQESLAQNIAALKMQLRFFERGLPQGDHKPREDLHQIMVTMDEIMDNLRRRAADLSPQMLMDLGLATGLKSLCEDYRLACTLDLEDLSKIFTMDEQVGIYRVFQEALNNISRHAQASQVTIAAKKTDDRVDFLIEDNGQGFDLDRLEGSGAELRGIGLSAMSERVRALGGTFKIESQPGVGTRIFFSLPRNRKQ